MKLKISLLTLFAAAGVLASMAIAKPPPGHGNHHQTGSTTGTTAVTTTTSGKHGKVLICHKVWNGHYVLVRVSAHSALARGKHENDVLAVNGTCPGPIQGHGHTTSTATTTTAATTTS